MKEFLQRFFEYNYQISQSLDTRFQSYHYQLDGEIIRLANHLINAHQIWIERIEGNITLRNPWEDFPIESFPSRNEALYTKTLEILKLVDLDAKISFHSFSGAAFEKRVSDMLIHIINHATYHRGQLASMMRKSGLEPVPSDYIHWAQA
ncbi:DinB family protein [Algoriphagus aestuariicola]|uniref:DinB family protein n=1 Tax=Algoriphagus aestuariicola TaxID=1852016 RepID=A0ABS3BMX5_9BACT|nr:DinB family protein [Algoriphagus aestuariicola]MBN7800513.1 DinB family protein [Algoriphagus aestuariicola]